MSRFISLSSTNKIFCMIREAAATQNVNRFSFRSGQQCGPNHLKGTARTMNLSHLSGFNRKKAQCKAIMTHAADKSTNYGPAIEPTARMSDLIRAYEVAEIEPLTLFRPIGCEHPAKFTCQI